MMEQVTLGFSVHRPEMIPVIAEQMRNYDTIILEEPPTPVFGMMLSGRMSIKDYLYTLALEFPEFSHRMCYLLRKLHHEGKKIVQVEPFLEILLQIHEFFADGHDPDEIQKNSIQYLVYLAERNATGALLAFYQTVMTGSFEKTLYAVKQFARLDAARFRLRDSLRAQALAPLVENDPSVYIEAGLIHYQLWMLLRRQMSLPNRLQLIFLADDHLKSIGREEHLYGSGDQLTLMNIFHPTLRHPEREAILAARSLIYSKIVVKEELTDDLSALPHLSDELACVQIVRRLSLEDCRRLFPLVRYVGTVQAHQIVTEYLADSKSHRRHKESRIHQHNRQERN